LKREKLYHILWGTRFGRGYAPVARQANGNVEDDVKS